jgi:hypothetical protein
MMIDAIGAVLAAMIQGAQAVAEEEGTIGEEETEEDLSVTAIEGEDRDETTTS